MNSRALTIVAGLFLASGALAFIGVVGDLFVRNRINVDLSVVNFWIGRWLLKREPRGLQWATVVSCLGMLLGPVLLLLVVVNDAVPTVRIFGIAVGHVSSSLVAAFVIAVTALQWWQYRVLSRPEIRDLFPRAAKSVAPSS